MDFISAGFIMEIHCHFVLSSQGKQSPGWPELFKQGVGGARLLLPSLPTPAPAQAGPWPDSNEIWESPQQQGIKADRAVLWWHSPRNSCLNTLKEDKKRCGWGWRLKVSQSFGWTCDSSPVGSQVQILLLQNTMSGQLEQGGGLEGPVPGVTAHVGLLHCHNQEAFLNGAVPENKRARLQEHMGKPGGEKWENVATMGQAQ